MKRTILLFILAIGMTGIAQTVSAHAIWIESEPNLVKNKAHEVRVYYGEYPAGEIEPTSKWFSDLKDLEVWVLSPSQKRSRLLLSDQNDHLKASFTPTEDGIYYISTAHSTKELGGTTKYEFSSLAALSTGTKSPHPGFPQQALLLVAQPQVYTIGQQIDLQVFKGADPYAGAEVQIMSPEGWIKTLKTDATGKISFTPRFKGKYVIEASEYKEEAGSWNSKNYTHSWKGSTTNLNIK